MREPSPIQSRDRISDLHALTLFHQNVEELLKAKGVKIKLAQISPAGKALLYELILGEKDMYDENDNKFYVPNVVGEMYNKITVTREKTHYDESGRLHRETERNDVEVCTFRSRELREFFPAIIRALPKSRIFRVVENEDALTIYFYIDVKPDELAQLQRTAKPWENNIVFFGQGEWVLVDGGDINHTIVSFGKGVDACRYSLVYDPILKRAAATHLDLFEDAEVVTQMRGYLIRSGSSRENLQLFGTESDDVPAEARENFKKQFSSVSYSLNDDFVFDVRSGLFSDLDDETEQNIREDKDAISRRTENTEIRLRRQIPNVLTYQSPNLGE